MLKPLAAVVAAAVVVWPACARAPESPAAILADAATCHGAPAPSQPGDPARAPGLLEGLGVAGFAPEGARDEAARYFEQGVRLFHSFNAPEAIRALRWAQIADPACAMCAWGEAWVRGPTINYPVDAKAAGLAHDALVRAQRLGAGLSPKSQALIAALAQRYPVRGGAARVDDAAYARAMEALAARFPDDGAVVTEAADALLIASGQAWAEPGAIRASPQVRRAREMLERVLARSPGYTPAIHFDIHLMEWSGEPARAVAAADRLGGLAPAAGHLVHMPSHLYFRLGRYEDAATSNARAVAADRAHVAALRPPGGLPSFALHAHNVSFGLAGALMSGDGPGALAFARAARASFGQDTGLGPRAWLAEARFGGPDEVLRAPRPGPAYAQALWRYARGEALARRGDAAGVAAEAREIGALKLPDRAGRSDRAVVEVARLTLEGRAALLAHRPADAVAAFRKAADLRDAVDTIPDPPIWPLPPRRSLGAALVLAGDLPAARAELAKSLARDREDPLALFALSEAQRRAGAESRTAAVAAKRGWKGDPAAFRLELI